MAIQAEYTLPTRSTVKLRGDGIHNNQWFNDDGLIDLLIDPNDYSNYYLNFSINRIDGNHPNDYYLNKKEYMIVQCPNCGANKYDENDNCLYCRTKVIVKSYSPNK